MSLPIVFRNASLKFSFGLIKEQPSKNDNANEIVAKYLVLTIVLFHIIFAQVPGPCAGAGARSCITTFCFTFNIVTCLI